MSGLGQLSVLHLEGEHNRAEGRGLGTQALPGTLGLSSLLGPDLGGRWS